MSHEITSTDTMFSVREKPWHGIGDVLEDDISVDDARSKYLVWCASKTPLAAEVLGDNGVIEYKPVPNKFGILREDTKTVLGVVGSKYNIYQNSDMWDFIHEYCRISGMQLETAGSLKGGQYTWVLLRGSEFEIIKGDPINKFFLFRNSFTGVVPVSVLFTNVRVVCNNTLNMALKSAQNIYNVRHYHNVVEQVAEIEKALGVHNVYQTKTCEILSILAARQMNETAMKQVLEDTIFPVPDIAVNDINVPDTTGKVVPIDMLKRRELVEKQRMLKIKRDRKVTQVLNLVDYGAGSDIPGVKGTAYGLFQALVEWVDHDKVVRASIHDDNSSRFENAMYTSIDFKSNALQYILKAAA